MPCRSLASSAVVRGPKPAARVLGVLAAALPVLSACQYAGDPFTDALADAPRVTTPSVESATAVDAERTDVQRPYAEAQAAPVPAQVRHVPLYFEDPHEGAADADGRFAWTRADYTASAYGLARWAVNLFAFPFSAYNDPPWVVMESDGRLDARRPAGIVDATRVAGCCPEPCAAPANAPGAAADQ